MNRGRRACALCSLLLALETPNAVRQLLNSHRLFKRLLKALIRLCVYTGWPEPLLVAHTTLLEILCRDSNNLANASLFNLFKFAQYIKNKLFSFLTLVEHMFIHVS